MAMRYYKKLNPSGPARLANGGTCQFTSLNGLVGYFSSDNEAVQRDFEQQTREGRGGITEIEAEEFVRDYVQKKTPEQTRSARPWREEISGPKIVNHTLLARLGREKVAAAVAVDQASTSTPAGAANGATVADAAGAPGQPANFTPPIGRRKARRLKP